jgi:hypothetical protein
MDKGAGVMNRRMVCTVLAGATLWLAPAAVAADPTAIYADYTLDGKLSCRYTRADLQAALRGVALNQYGDPFTVAGLKRAIRRQLAPGGCARANSGSSGIWWIWFVVGLPLLVALGTGAWSVRRAFFRPAQ